ncbi:MAG: hypothetical protein E7558_08750 [Ruminococcaceae bacterium]|nr:hypothetical protein [Oscillospiraceae bacterium]
MSILRPSMVKSAIVYVDHLPDTAISQDKRDCIKKALRKRLPMGIDKTGSSLRCPDCGCGLTNLHTSQYCPVCGQRLKV